MSQIFRQQGHMWLWSMTQFETTVRVRDCFFERFGWAAVCDLPIIRQTLTLFEMFKSTNLM